MNTTYNPPRLKALFSLAWPMVISRASQVIVGMSDALMIAVLGESALAAVTTGSVNTILFLIFFMGTVFIVSSFSSQFFGQSDLAGARRYGWYGLGIAFFAQVIALLSIFFISPLLSLFPYSEDVRQLMVSYMVIRLLSAGSAIGLEALSNYFGGLSLTHLPMIANITAMGFNVFINWVLIFGKLGMPALGIEGAAWASFISTFIGFFFLFFIFLFRNRPDRSQPVIPLQISEFWRMIRFGVPSGFNWFFEMFAFTFFINVVVSSLGTTALAAMMAVLQVNITAFMPAFGLMSAGAILAGQAIGAAQKIDVYRIARLTLTVTIVWLAVVSIIYIAFPVHLMIPFVEESSATRDLFLKISREILILAAAWQIFDAISGTYAEILRAAGDTSYTMKARFFVSWVIFVPATLISTYVFHANQTVAAFWVVFYLALLAWMFWRRFSSRKWERLDLTGKG